MGLILRILVAILGTTIGVVGRKSAWVSFGGFMMGLAGFVLTCVQIHTQLRDAGWVKQ